MIPLHTHHVTEVYCSGNLSPVVPLISWLAEYRIISAKNI